MFFHTHKHRRECGRGHGRWSRGPFTMVWDIDTGRGGGRGRRRMFEGGELRLLLLRLIEEAPRHGYDLIREIEERSGGAYAPSPGVVYPTLTLLADMGLIEEQQAEGARKVYAITTAGQTHLTEREAEVEALFARLAEMGSERARSGGGPVRRAMRNLRSVLEERIGEGEAGEEQLHEIAEIIDEAARRVERLRGGRGE